jgi:putative membrane protein
MGNYHLVMIEAVNHVRLDILFPFILGGLLGVIPFTRFLSWLLKRFHDFAIALLTGFILGSLGTLWPWKKSVIETFGGKEVITGFEWHLPPASAEFAIGFALCIAGIFTIYTMELLAKKLERVHTIKNT